MRLYLDANVFVSAVREELGRGLRGLFVESNHFFEKVSRENHTLILSDWFFEECARITCMEKEDILNYFKAINVKIELIAFTTDDAALKQKWVRQGIHAADAKHLAIALVAKANALVTFNASDFAPALGSIKIFMPNDF